MSSLLAGRLSTDEPLDDFFPACTVGPQQIQSTNHILGKRQVHELLAFVPEAQPVSTLTFSIRNRRSIARRSPSSPPPFNILGRSPLHLGHARDRRQAPARRMALLPWACTCPAQATHSAISSALGRSRRQTRTTCSAA